MVHSTYGHIQIKSPLHIWDARRSINTTRYVTWPPTHRFTVPEWPHYFHKSVHQTDYTDQVTRAMLAALLFPIWSCRIPVSLFQSQSPGLDRVRITKKQVDVFKNPLSGSRSTRSTIEYLHVLRLNEDRLAFFNRGTSLARVFISRYTISGNVCTLRWVQAACKDRINT